MTDNTKPTSGVGVTTSTVETSMGADGGMTMGVDKAGKATITEQGSGATTVDLGSRTQSAEGILGKDTEPAGDNDSGTVTETPDDADSTSSEADTAGELPDFDSTDPDKVAAYDKAFTKDDGAALNLDALSAKWWTSIKDGNLDTGSLGEGTYKYLADTWGISEGQTKEIEKGLVAQRKIERSERVKAAGDSKEFQAAVEWGTKGGYTPEQRQAFNAAFNGADQTKAIEAVELLMARHGKATKSGVNPKVNSTANASGGPTGSKTADVFKSRDEWQAATTAAGKDPVKRQAVSDKFRRSPGARTW